MTWLFLGSVLGLLATIAAATLWLCRPSFSWPSMDDDERQTFAFLSLFAGEAVLTLLWIGLYAFEAWMHSHFGVHSALSEAGQEIVWKLMGIHAGAIAAIAIGSIVSARFGDWFEIRRQEGSK